MVAGLAGLAGCVAIANRKPEGCTLSLEQFDSNERRIFRDMISSVSLECPGMSASLKAKLADHMTIQQLIIKLDCLYRDYILRHWKPQMVQKLAPKPAAATQAEIDALAPCIEWHNTQAVLQHLFEQMSISRAEFTSMENISAQGSGLDQRSGLDITLTFPRSRASFKIWHA